jgi:ankyrin repeat protein
MPASVKTLETRDNDSATALLLACSTMNRCATEVLLKKGAKICVEDMYLNSSLHRVQSAEKGITVARLLLDYPDRRIDIDQKNIYDKTALHLASEIANELIVDLPLDHSSDTNCQGPAKYTPLHVAIYSRRISIVKKLLERGADTNVRDNRWLDAATAAKTTKLASQDIIKLVIEHEHRVDRDRRRLSQAGSLELPSGERRKSSTTSELMRMETSGTLGQNGGQIRKQPSPSSLSRKETVYLQSSSAGREVKQIRHPYRT